jgi:cyclic-di-GMP phosphodiesterase TipF (flagellum assembly factor)
MGLRPFLLSSIAAVGAVGLTLVAARYDLLVLVVAAMAAGIATGVGLLRHQAGLARAELSLLRDHLEATRQQAALLARHTRELRDAVLDRDQRQALGLAAQPDIGSMSEIIRDVADAVADLDRRTEAVEGEVMLLRRDAMNRTSSPGPLWAAPSAPVPAAYAPDPAPALRESPGFAPNLKAVPPVPSMAGMTEPPRAVRQLVAAAIAADRFDLFMQRIVTLPQRKTRAYEVSLRPDGCDPRITTGDIRTAVEHVGHQLAFDRKLMVQTVRLARLFEQRGRDVLLVTDISQRYLLSEAAFDELRALVADAPDAPRRIILSLPQRFFRKAVAVENEAIRLMSDMGFRFMMREVDDFNLDLPRLQASNVRWVRMNAARLIAASQSSENELEVAAADFAALLGRRQISLLVDEVADEASVVELIDFNIAYAQGPVFSPPQAVRPEALEPQVNAPATLARAMAEQATHQPERRGLREIARRA